MNGEYILHKTDEGRYKLELSMGDATEPAPRRLSFFRDIRDQFYDENSFAQDEAFNNKVVMEVQSIAVQCGVLDVHNKRHMTAFKNFCPSGLHFYRSPSIEKTVSALCFLNLLWFADDLLDDGHLTDEQSQHLVDSVADVFTADYKADKGTEWANIVGYALTVREHLAKHMSEQWIEHFGKSYRTYAKASLEETRRSRKRLDMTIDEYADLRMHTSAVFPCQELLAMLYNFEFEPSEDIDRARTLVNRIISFTNDIFSFEKEYNSNSLNLLIVCMNQEKCTLNKAVELCVGMVNRDIEELIEIENRTKGLGEWYIKAIEGMKIMVQGNAIWSKNTKRYCTPTSPFDDLREQYAFLSSETKPTL